MRLERTVEPGGTRTVPAVWIEPPQWPLSRTRSGVRTAPAHLGQEVDSANAEASNDAPQR